jgi:parallel beta-helix repeat protein
MKSITGGKFTLTAIFATLGLYLAYAYRAPARYAHRDPPAIATAAAEVSPGPRYYVSPTGSDGNDGSRDHPWSTIGRAARQARPGVVVIVLRGTYLSSGEIKTKANGTPNARISFVSETQWGATLISTETGNSAVWNNEGDYVDIKGFEVTGAGALGIYNYGSHVRIMGNHVHDIPASGCPENGGAGIHNGNASAQDDDVIGNVVNHIGDYDNPCPRVHGIYYMNLGGHAWNNIVYRNQGWGIHAWHAASNTVIANNSVFNNGYGGILIGASFDAGRPNDYTVVSNNIVYRNGLGPKGGGYGIEEYGNTGTHNLYLNNLVYQNGPADWSLQNGNQASGTVSADPQFVNYTGDGKGDYHLRPTSPALHKAIDQGVPAIGRSAGAQSSDRNLGAYSGGILCCE